MRKDGKKYNRYTKGYKIDIFASTIKNDRWNYVGSTDWSKTCREAKKRYIELNEEFCKDKNIFTRFDKS